MSESSHTVVRAVKDPSTLTTEIILEGEHELLHQEIRDGNTFLIFKRK